MQAANTKTGAWTFTFSALIWSHM